MHRPPLTERPPGRRRSSSVQRVLGGLTRPLNADAKPRHVPLEDIAEGRPLPPPLRRPRQQQQQAPLPPTLPRRQLALDASLLRPGPQQTRAEAEAAATRHPHLTRRDAGALALLAWELRTASGHRQQLSLRAFLHRCGQGGLERVAVSRCDARELLAVLFVLLHRRGGTTPWQIAVHQAVAALAFRALCSVLSAGRWFSVLRGALVSLLAEVGHPSDEYVRRPWMQDILAGRCPPPPPQPPAAPACSPLAEAEQEARDADIALAAALQPPRPPPQCMLQYLRTLHCLDQRTLGGLTEGRFLRIAADFSEIDSDGSGVLDFSELIGSGSAWVGGHDIACREFLQSVDCGGKGQLTLQQLLAHWFPHVPARFIARRIRIFQIERQMRRMREDCGERSSAAAGSDAVSRTQQPLSPFSDSAPPAGDFAGEGEEEAPLAAAAMTPSPQSAVSQHGAAHGLSPACRTTPVEQPSPRDAATEPDVWGLEDAELVCDDWREALHLAARLTLRAAPSGSTATGEGSCSALAAALSRCGVLLAPSSLTVSAVQPGSEAAQRGARPGWRLAELNGVTVSTAGHAAEALADAGGAPCHAVLRAPAEAAAAALDALPADGAPPLGAAQAAELIGKGPPPWGPEAAALIVEQIESLDTDGSGAADAASLAENGGMIAGVPVSPDPGGELRAAAVCRLLYPAEGPEAVAEALGAAAETAGARARRRAADRRDDEAAWRAEPDRGDAAARRRSLEERAAATRGRLRELQGGPEPLGTDAAPAAPASTGAQPPAPTEPEDTAAAAAHVAGLCLGPERFSLLPFLSDTQTRAAAVTLLERLDAAGVDARYLCPVPFHFLPHRLYGRSVYRALAAAPPCPPLTTMSTRCTSLFFYTNLRPRSDLRYRLHFEGFNWGLRPARLPFDQARPGMRVRLRPCGAPAGSSRVGTVQRRTRCGVVMRWDAADAREAEEAEQPQRWWDGEGRPFTVAVSAAVNTVVCGSCGLASEHLGEAADYGWPLDRRDAGWVGETVAHLNAGLSGAHQYYSYDGTVTVRLSAPCIARAGVVASAWIDGIEIGNPFQLAASFSYVNKDLCATAVAAAVHALHEAAAGPPPPPRPPSPAGGWEEEQEEEPGEDGGGGGGGSDGVPEEAAERSAEAAEEGAAVDAGDAPAAAGPGGAGAAGGPGEAPAAGGPEAAEGEEAGAEQGEGEAAGGAEAAPGPGGGVAEGLQEGADGEAETA